VSNAEFVIWHSSFGIAMMLVLSKTLYDEVIAHCRSRYPKEACGLLAGAQGAAEWTVVQVYPMRNVEDSPVGYSMDPKEQLLVENQMRQRRQMLIGIFHSHTATEAYPSPVDVSLAISPDLSYVLVSLKDQQHPVINSYRIVDRTILQEELRLTR